MSKTNKEKKIRSKTCMKCNAKLPISDFTSNSKLFGGFLPWCDPCLEEHGKNLPDLYQKHYQKLYHKKRIMNESKEQGKRRTKRGVHRLSKEAIKELLPKKLTVATIRRPIVFSELILALPALKKTDSWILFEEEIIDSFFKRNPGGKKVDRYLPEYMFPEFALCPSNCFVPGKKDKRSGRIDLEELETGLELLAQCIKELLSNG